MVHQNILMNIATLYLCQSVCHDNLGKVNVVANLNYEFY